MSDKPVKQGSFRDKAGSLAIDTDLQSEPDYDGIWIKNKNLIDIVRFAMNFLLLFATFITILIEFIDINFSSFFQKAKFYYFSKIKNLMKTFY